MKNVVTIYNDELRVGTFLIAQGFKRDHKKITNLIKKYTVQFMELEVNKSSQKGLIVQRVHSKKAGRPIEEFLLNEAQTMFLGTLFRTSSNNPDDPVLRFKVRLSKDFTEMKDLLFSLQSQRQSKEWIENRAAGKVIRKEETDTIKDFIVYAKEQGSTKADYYYIVLSKCVNDNLFTFEGKFKIKRDAMNNEQTITAKFADRIVSRALIEGMAMSLPYKEIYKMVKSRIIDLAKMYGKSKVVDRKLHFLEKRNIPESARALLF